MYGENQTRPNSDSNFDIIGGIQEENIVRVNVEHKRTINPEAT